MAKKRRKTTPGDVRKLQEVLWETLEMVQHYLLEPHGKGERVEVDDLCESLSWSVELTEDNKTSMTVRNGGRVVSLPSTPATIRGISGVTLLIEDEAANVDDELLYTVMPMLATTAGRHILMSTPFGKRGHFWEIWDQAPGWNKVRIPADEVPRISSEFLEDAKATMPQWWFLQEYMCEFTDSTDQVFQYDLVQTALSDEFEAFV